MGRASDGQPGQAEQEGQGRCCEKLSPPVGRDNLPYQIHILAINPNIFSRNDNTQDIFLSTFSKPGAK
jgi:hypothetical protein